MKNERNLNSLSVTAWVLVIAVFTCNILFLIQDKFGLLSGDVQKANDYNVEIFISKENISGKNFEIFNEKTLYINKSREFFGKVKSFSFDDNGDIVAIVESSGFVKDGTFFLNGKNKLEYNEYVNLMGESIQAKITSISKS